MGRTYGPTRNSCRLCRIAPAEGEVLEHFASLKKSLSGRALSVDATGGFDSRLVLCLLGNQSLPFELAISGLPGTADTEIARQIATMLGRPFHLVGPRSRRFR